MAWLSMAEPVPMSYNKTQMGMQYPLLGVVLHTTNHGAGAETIHRFRNDWQAAQKQSAHFVIDRSGTIGQCRNTTAVAWHMNMHSIRYIGIEHIAKLDSPLTSAQIEASGQLLAWCSDFLSIPLQLISGAGKPGIGIHSHFESTWCGRKTFWSGSTKGTGQFGEIVETARSYARWGLYDYGQRAAP